MTKTVTEQQICCVSEKTIGNKKYIVKSVFGGDKDVKDTLLKLAERKALRAMGIEN
jgi:hypothetical protein